ncbi:MAG TPA: ATP-binding protein [Blastocatellia bacterium]|jgi:PAS domain S-box-containing protein|nr:ATP-binding protein [Blastocatellia bacterium]
MKKRAGKNERKTSPAKRASQIKHDSQADTPVRKKTKASRTNEERFRTLADSAPVLMWVAGPDGCEFVNREYLEFLGASEADVQGNGWEQFVHPEDREAYANAYHEAVSCRVRFEAEFRFRRRDGEYRWMRTVGMPHVEGGEFKGYAGSTYDVSESKRAEERLREDAEIIETINRTGRAISAELNLQTVVQEVTDAATELVGARYGAFFYNVIDQNGESYMLYTLSGAPREAFANFPMVRNTALFGPTFRGERTIRIDDVKKDPRYGKNPPYRGMPPAHLPVRSYLAVPVVSRTEVWGGLLFGHPEVGVFTERHERIVEGLAAQTAIAMDNARLYELSQREREKAEEANRLKDEFLATISHELRSPLNAILGWTRMLNDKWLDEENSARALEVIYRSARAQNQLISDLLDVSRIITGKLRIETGMINLIPVIEAATDVARPAADAKNIRLISALDPETGPVSGDAGRLQQIVWNLLSNAVKFTPAGGRVSVRLERDGASVKITISDTGDGIEPEFLPFVFDRFRQFESGPARPAGGLGLGLAIVRHVVESHGGTVNAASRGRGQGATFTVTLPQAIPTRESSKAARGQWADAAELPPSHPPAPERLRDLRVLVVDDDPDARDLFSLILTSYGAEVRSCDSSPEALHILDEWTPDVLVSDIGMPLEDGYELMKKVRAREPERGGRVPALALTAYARAEDARRAISVGYQAHVTKPIEPSQLATVVAGLAGRGEDD